MKNVDNPIKLKKTIQNISNLIDFCFSNKLLGNSEISNKMKQAVYMTIVFNVYKNYNLKELRPRYCQTFIEHRYFNLLTNLANKLNIEIE